MPEKCISCSSFAKFWVRDGDHTKPVCTYHQIKFAKEGYLTYPMTKVERE